MSIVGLPETAVREAKDRVKAALLNAGFDFPAGHVTISLAPADLPKEGSRFDLPIALAILCANGQCDAESFSRYLIAGELSLDGSLRGVHGVLPMALASGLVKLGDTIVVTGSHPFGAQASTNFLKIQQLD